MGTVCPRFEKILHSAHSPNGRGFVPRKVMKGVKEAENEAWPLHSVHPPPNGRGSGKIIEGVKEAENEALQAYLHSLAPDQI